VTLSAACPVVSSYSVHGVGVAIDANRQEVIDAIESRLRPFATDGLPDPPLRIEIAAVDALLPLDDVGSGRPVYDSDLGTVSYLDGQDRLLIDCALAQVDARLRSGRASIRYVDVEDGQDLASHPLLTLALLELLKRRERFALHASCAVRDGAGALFTGPSGSGKTTLAIAMARAGWGFGSDDMVFLGPVPGAGPDVMPFPDEVDLTPDGVTRFPELAHLMGTPVRGLRQKHQLRLETVFDAPMALTCRPSVVFFPTLSRGRGSEIVPMTAADALRELLPNVLLTDMDASQQHLDVLGQLVTHTPCFRLRLGTDVEQAVDVVAGVAR
jgi:hypothetical protein